MQKSQLYHPNKNSISIFTLLTSAKRSNRACRNR